MKIEKVFLIVGIMAVIAIVGTFLYNRSSKLKHDTSGEEELAPPSTEDIKKELSRIIKKFYDNFGALLNVASGQTDMAENVFENLTLTIKHSDSVLIKDWWKNFIANNAEWEKDIYISKASELLRMFKSIGVHQGGTDDVVIDDSVRDKYAIMDNLVNGDVGKVSTPYWEYNGNIVEKGILIK